MAELLSHFCPSSDILVNIVFMKKKYGKEFSHSCDRNKQPILEQLSLCIFQMQKRT